VLQGPHPQDLSLLVPGLDPPVWFRGIRPSDTTVMPRFMLGHLNPQNTNDGADQLTGLVGYTLEVVRPLGGLPPRISVRTYLRTYARCRGAITSDSSHASPVGGDKFLVTVSSEGAAP
jgi:hypothetical protein